MEEEISYVVAPPPASTSRIMSSEIVEVGGEDNRNNNSVIINDVYVAVGKDDLDVLKWVLDHLVFPGVKVFLVHVFPPMAYVSTPVGRLSKSQLSKDQVRYYINEEHNRRRNLLQKYIRLCNDAKVSVDTMLLESTETAKAILDLIPVLNITNLVMGTTHPPRSRLLKRKLAKGEFVKKNAPDYCEVTIVNQQAMHPSLSSNSRTTNFSGNSERKFFECVCFSGKFN